LGKVLGFTTQIINPDRLIDKFTGKEGLFENSPFDDRTRQVIAQSKIPVGIFLDKQPEELERIFVPIFSIEDRFLIEYKKWMLIAPYYGYDSNNKMLWTFGIGYRFK
jgi:hypothetical protein